MLFPRLLGLIVAVGVVCAAVACAGLPVDTIASRFGALPRGLPLPELPPITRTRITEPLPSALVIAFLAAIGSLLSAMVGGMPATGAIARTATNVRAGGKTPVAGVLHALFILVIMLAAAPLAGYLAMPALAALLLITAWNMSEPHKWRAYMAAPGEDRGLLLVTPVLTVVADLTVAIGVGVMLGLALRLRARGREGQWGRRARPAAAAPASAAMPRRARA